jgi:hypothetical protein
MGKLRNYLFIEGERLMPFSEDLQKKYLIMCMATYLEKSGMKRGFTHL